MNNQDAVLRKLARSPTHSKSSVIPNAALVSSFAVIVYYLVPFTIPALGFSPHVLAVFVGIILLLIQRPIAIQRNVLFLLLGLLTIMMILILNAPNRPSIDMVRAWLISLATFWLFFCTYKFFSIKKLDVGARILLWIWSLAAIAQAFFGGWAYFSVWFGMNPNVVYSTGLSNYSNQAATLLVPMLIWNLVFNIEHPSFSRSLLWISGCAALYLTLSRAGWFALLVAIMVLIFRLYGNRRYFQQLILHAVLAILIAVIAWAAPTRIDSYEPFGSQSSGRWIGDDYSSATRLVTLQVAAKAVMDYPMTGVGLGRFPEFYAEHYKNYLSDEKVDQRDRVTPHNGYAQFIAEVGIPAFLILLVWFGWLLRGLLLSTEPDALALYASIIGVMVWMLFHDGLYDRQLWILLGCAAALRDKYKLLWSRF